MYLNGIAHLEFDVLPFEDNDEALTLSDDSKIYVSNMNALLAAAYYGRGDIFKQLLSSYSHLR